MRSSIIDNHLLAVVALHTMISPSTGVCVLNCRSEAINPLASTSSKPVSLGALAACTIPCPLQA